MLFISILIIMLLAFIHGTASNTPITKTILPNIQIEYTNDRVSECIMKITKEHISCRSIIFIVSSNNYQDFLLQSLNDYECFLIITRSFTEQKWLIYPDAYFIFANNITDFFKGIEEMSRDLSWRPEAKFMIFLSEKGIEIPKVFEKLLKLMVINVVLLTNNENNELEAFTYYPYSGNNCGQNASDIRSLGYCPKFSETLFPDKVSNGFRNCTIVVAAKEDIPYVLVNNTEYAKYLQTGAEQFVLDTIAKYEGFYIIYNYVSPDTDYGVILPNGTCNGLLGYLRRHEAAIIIGSLFISGNRIEIFDYIFGYSYTMFSVFTPTIQEQRWARVYQQFSGVTWLLIILSFFFTILVILVTKALTSGKTNDEFLIILKLWKYFYGQADVGLFKDIYIKRILIVWVIFTSSIYAFYNTASYSLVTGHVRNKIRINQSDLASLPYKPCISKFTRIFYISAYNETLPKGDDEDNPLCQDGEEVFKNVATRNDLYTIDCDYTYNLRAIKYLDSEGQPTVDKWDYPRINILSMYMQKGFPLREIFQKYAHIIYETGLIDKHLSYIFSRKPKPIQTLKRKVNVIRLEDFKIHYYILLIGLLISFLCFIIEYNIG